MNQSLAMKSSVEGLAYNQLLAVLNEDHDFHFAAWQNRHSFSVKREQSHADFAFELSK